MRSIPDRVFEYILHHPKCSGPEIAAGIGETKAAISAPLRHLRKRGAIAKLEQRVGNRWEWVVTTDMTPEFRRRILWSRPQCETGFANVRPKDTGEGDGGLTLAKLMGY